MISFLYTNIGRGHPFYLDGIVETLRHRNYDSIYVKDVFEASQGSSKQVWKLARRLYKIGSTDSIIGKLYNKLRDSSEYDNSSMAMKKMGSDITIIFGKSEGALVVAHPVLVGILKGRQSLIYQHGEIAVPKQAVVRGAEYVLVPTDECKQVFQAAGYSKEQVVVTGLCIEPELKKQAESAYEERLVRLSESEELTGAFFSSGAEPKPHVRKILEAVQTIARTKGKAIVFAIKDGRLHKLLKSKIEKSQLEKTIKICSYSDRVELNKLTAENFNEFDYFVSPAHERTNWALGLGLPMFILEPSIGPFSPLNREYLLKSGVGISVTSRTTEEFYWALDFHRKSKNLIKMSEAGWNVHSIHGFETIADFLINKFPLNS